MCVCVCVSQYSPLGCLIWWQGSNKNEDRIVNIVSFHMLCEGEGSLNSSILVVTRLYS